MMARKKTPDELYWQFREKEQAREEYERFLKAEGKENTPHNAHVFAIKMIGCGHDYMGMKERDLILFLAGELPYMYD